MQRFAQLISEIDATTSTNRRIEALHRFFQDVDDQDKMWAIALLGGKRPKRVVATTRLREWCAEISKIPLWLFEESYHIVGDLAETIALLLPEAKQSSHNNLSSWMNYLEELRMLEEEEKKRSIIKAWSSLDKVERFAFNKLITGGFRIGVSQKNLAKALSRFSGQDINEVTYRLMGNWSPISTSYSELMESDLDADISRPYPFFLAYPLESDPKDLGDPGDWFIERKWDGIRGQIIKREGEGFIWSRGEELMTDRLPELHELLNDLPDGTVIDCELVAHDGENILPFQVLQKRIGRKKIGKKLLQDAPVRVIAYDLLEWQGKDLRNNALQQRRGLLEALVEESKGTHLLISPVLQFKDWDSVEAERLESRKYFAEGFMLKKKDSVYESGRKKGNWWKWKLDPLTIDAILIYAMRGHGRRANLYTDYTFGVWKGDDLVPFTKAYSGLTDAEFKKVDQFVKKNTLERFGPVRSVKAELVFEIAFEGIAASSRHKSGISLRFPRMHRWRIDKSPEEANSLDDLQELLHLYGND